MAQKANFIEADNTSFEQNLRIVRNDLDDELNKYFGGAEGLMAPERNFKIVTPQPGFCIKSFKVNTNEKYFINVCQTKDIPPPEDITEEELSAILESDEPSTFRIPMSISEPRITNDKANNPVDVCDIAINPQFFAKCQKSMLFKDFFMALIAEALSEKYNVQLAQNKSIILQYRQFVGTLVQHRVRNSDVKNVLTSYKNPTEADREKLIELDGGKKPLVQEITPKEIDKLMKSTSKQSIADLQQLKKSISQAASIVPEYKIRATLNANNSLEELIAEFHLPKCISAKEITLDVGEDHILLESMKHGYLFEKFVDLKLDNARSEAVFDAIYNMLIVRVPIISN